MPSVSEAQHRAMEAAVHGRSALGIPESVGREFVAADEFNEADHPRAPDGKFGSGGQSPVPQKKKLTATQKSYISSYTGDDFYQENKALRDGAVPSSLVKHVDEAISGSKLMAGTKLYRGMDKEAAIKFLGTRNIEAGMEVSDKAFMSTSREPVIGYGSMGGVVFEIETTEGQEGLDTAGLTRNPQEKEVLLPRNTKMRVKSIVPPKKVGDPIRIKVETVTGGASRQDGYGGGAYTISDSIEPAMIKAAGIMIVTARDGKALFLKRSQDSDHPGEWCFPGGKIEGDETAVAAAERETQEEIGAALFRKPAEWTRRIAEGVDFTTFITKSESEFTPTVDAEHTAWTWAPVNDPPEPLHPGARVALNRLTMDELGIARAMAAGDLVSPQKYENLWLFAIRITGTGASYRSGLDEHVWRAPEVYLNDEFLARCNGLAVVWIHPKKAMLDSDEFAKRVIGTCFLPYIANDDGIQNPEGQSVWSIAKIYDEKSAGEMQSRQISTSPGVVFRDPSVNTKVELEDGRTLLIEGKPALLDHIAVVDLGVWDKGGPATGILNNSLTERNDSMAEENPRLDADGGNIDKLLSRLDEVVGKALKPVMDRMDAMEVADKARRDAECEKARADAQSRRDAEREEWAKSDAEGCARDDAEEASEAEAMEKAGEPKEVAADKARSARKDRMKARRDAAESEAEKSAREDAARRDAEESARKDADARAERARADAIAADSRRIADALANMPKSMNDADYAAMADAQQVYDPAYQAFGQRARAPMQGEDLLAYRRSLARGLQKHSPDWKGVDLHALPDAALSIAENRIRADAVVASRSTDDLPDGELFPIRRTNESGHQITEFRGRTTIFKQFTPPHKRVTKFLTERRA